MKKLLIAILLCVFVLVPLTPKNQKMQAAEKTSSTEIDVELQRAKTLSQLQNLLIQHPEQKRDIVPKIEKTIIIKIQKETRKLFMLSDIKPQALNYGGAWSLKAENIIDEFASFDFGQTRMLISPKGSHATNIFWTAIQYGDNDTGKEYKTGNLTIQDVSDYGVILEYKGDEFPPFIRNSTGGLGVFIASENTKKIATHDLLPMGDGSIHRFSGKVELFGYIFTGEGDDLNRLTFLLTKKGYIYMRGKGKVIMKNGKEVKLGY